MYLCIKKKVRGGLANYSILESRQTFVCICHESRQLPDYWSIPTVQTVYGSRKTILNFVSSYTLNHPLPALRPSRRVTNHSCTKCRQPRPPASAPRSPWGISSNTWSTVPRGLGDGGARLLRGAKFTGASPPAAYDQDLIGKAARAWRAGGRPSPAPWKELLALTVCCWIWSPWHGELRKVAQGA